MLDFGIAKFSRDGNTGIDDPDRRSVDGLGIGRGHDPTCRPNGREGRRSTRAAICSRPASCSRDGHWAAERRDTGDSEASDRPPIPPSQMSAAARRRSISSSPSQRRIDAYPKRGGLSRNLKRLRKATEPEQSRLSWRGSGAAAAHAARASRRPPAPMAQAGYRRRTLVSSRVRRILLASANTPAFRKDPVVLATVMNRTGDRCSALTARRSRHLCDIAERPWSPIGRCSPP